MLIKQVLGLAVFFLVAARAELTDGLIGHYPFNGDALDESGQGLNGVMTNTIPFIDRFGSPAAAFWFNGSNAVVNLGNHAAFNFEGDFTLSAWIMADQPQVNKYILGKYFFPQASAYGLGTAENSNLYAFVHNDPGNTCQIHGSLSSADGKWHMFTAVFERHLSLRGYVDGVEVASSPSIVNHTSTLFNEDPLLIGGISSGQFFRGGIDDVRIYRRALSSAEVRQLYAQENPCSPHAAKATATVINGFVVALEIVDPGCGYIEAPTVAIFGGSGRDATATATVSNGVVTGIIVTDAGRGYTTPPIVLIDSPPFEPSLMIEVSKVRVRQRVVIGRRYILEGSSDFKTWTPIGLPFTAQSEATAQEVDVETMGRYFRIREVP